MTAQELVQVLCEAGIELEVDGGNLRVRALKSKLTEDQRKLISDNKADLLSYLAGQSNEHNCGSPPPSDPPAAAIQPKAENSRHDVYKEYTLPDGQKLQLTKQEFDRVVELFQQLADQDARLRKNSSAPS